jgi:hypothetical protein
MTSWLPRTRVASVRNDAPLGQRRVCLDRAAIRRWVPTASATIERRHHQIPADQGKRGGVAWLHRLFFPQARVVGGDTLGGLSIGELLFIAVLQMPVVLQVLLDYFDIIPLPFNAGVFALDCRVKDVHDSPAAARRLTSLIGMRRHHQIPAAQQCGGGVAGFHGGSY